VTDPRFPQIISDNKFVIKTEAVEESYHWFAYEGGVEYVLFKTYRVKSEDNLGQSAATPQEESFDMESQTVDFMPFWVLHVRVQTAVDPEHMAKGLRILQQIDDKFAGLFDFKVFDRRAHDTRDLEPPASSAGSA